MNALNCRQTMTCVFLPVCTKLINRDFVNPGAESDVSN